MPSWPRNGNWGSAERRSLTTSARKAFVLQLGKTRPRKGSDLPKVTQRVESTDKSGWGTFAASRALPSLRGDLRDTSSLGRGVYCETSPRADRSPALSRYVAGGAAPTPPEPWAARERRPDRARRLTAGPARGDLLLTWSRAVSLSVRRAGQPPFSAQGLLSPATSRVATQPDPPPPPRLSAIRPQPRSPGPRPPLRDSPPWDAATPRQQPWLALCPTRLGLPGFPLAWVQCQLKATQTTYSRVLSRELHPSYFRNRSKQQGANQVKWGWLWN